MMLPFRDDTREILAKELFKFISGFDYSECDEDNDFFCDMGNKLFLLRLEYLVGRYSIWPIDAKELQDGLEQYANKET